jgi:hypothetical protein
MIISLKTNDLNPIWLLYILCLQLVDKKDNENSLYELLTISGWIDMI